MSSHRHPGCPSTPVDASHLPVDASYLPVGASYLPVGASRRPWRRGPAAAPALVAAAGTVLVLGVLVGALLVAGGVEGQHAGLPDAGPLTRWGLPVARLLTDLSAVAALGLLVCGAVLVPTPAPDLGAHARRLLVLGGRWGTAWCASAAVTFALTASDIAGVPVRSLATRTDLATLWALPPTRALLQMAALTTLVALGARRTRTHTGAAGLLVVAVLALLPATVTGHAGHGASPVLASAALVVHVVAASAWVGGLGALVLHLRHRPGLLAVVLPGTAPWRSAASSWLVSAGWQTRCCAWRSTSSSRPATASS